MPDHDPVPLQEIYRRPDVLQRIDSHPHQGRRIVRGLPIVPRRQLVQERALCQRRRREDAVIHVFGDTVQVRCQVRKALRIFLRNLRRILHHARRIRVRNDVQMRTDDRFDSNDARPFRRLSQQRDGHGRFQIGVPHVPHRSAVARQEGCERVDVPSCVDGHIHRGRSSPRIQCP